jgi:hypothetical protein
MIAADTSTWIAFLEGERGEDVQLLDATLRDRQVVMVPVVTHGAVKRPEASFRAVRSAWTANERGLKHYNRKGRCIG